MSETLKGRHYTVLLSDDEFKDVKRQAVESDMKVKEWVRCAIVEKLTKVKEVSNGD